MPLDHFISQVHLKRFYSPVLENRMYAVRKADLFAFTPTAKDICRIENGSNNPYLKDERAIEDFLKGVEPKYNASIEKLRNQTTDRECISTIAGFVSYVMCCSPAAMRLGSTNLQSLVDTTSRVMDAHGAIPPAPSELENDLQSYWMMEL